MKKIYFIFLFFAFNVNAQFIHLNVNQKSDDPVRIVFEDGSVKNGYAKNNKAKNNVVRALAFGNNSNAFNTPELAIDNILFKESKNEDKYQEIDVMSISQVIFNTDEKGYLVYDRSVMYDINAKTLEVDFSNPKKMFFQANNLPGFKRYRIFVKMTLNRKTSYFYTPYYYLKSPTKNEVIYVNPWSMIIHDRVVNYFKFVGSDCDSFISFLDKIVDKKSDEYLAFKKAKKDLKKANKEAANLKKKHNKENKKSKNPVKNVKLTPQELENITQLASADSYEFLFNYYYQKYLDCGCEPR